jgi:hypothetical protein
MKENMKMGTLTERFDVNNLDQWGRLIKSWATHLDYVSKPNDPQPPRDYWVNKSYGAPNGPAGTTMLDIDKEGKPEDWCLPPGGPVLVPSAGGGAVALPLAVAMTAEEFTDRVKAAGVKVISMPKQYKKVIIVQGDVGTMVMRLPPKDTLQGSEDDLLNGEPYPVRPFYGKLYSGTLTRPAGQTDIMELHANRIGEYTLNNCA